MKRFRTIFAGMLVVATAACSGGSDSAANASAATDSAAAGAATESAPAVTPTGTVVEVKMISDDTGNRFEPAEVSVKRGDVVRFVLAGGAHNVSFPAEKNPAGATLPAPAEILQLPGQTYELAVNLPAGTYEFQCDPHAPLGMTGKLTVTD